MNEPRNFYTIGGTLLPTAKSYVTRRADNDLLNHLLNGDFCFVLTSRQMGKSSLMVRTALALRKEGVKVAILDLTRIGQNLTPDQWYDGLQVRLGAELNLEDELDDYWTSERVSRLGPMQRFMGVLREVVLPAVSGSVAIFIDEIDSVRSLPFSSDEFFAGIRECYNSRVSDPEFNRLSFCLLGVAQPSDLISNVYITPFNIGHRIELTDFSEKESHPLLEGLRSKSTKPGGAEALLHRVLYWTGGHPYLTQRLCDTIGHLDRELTLKDVDLACEELFLSSRSREKEDNLIFVRDRVLASRESRAAIPDLYKKVHSGETVRDDDSNATIDPLRLSGLLLVSNGSLKVRNRIYATVFNQHWITANMPDAELRRQKAAYRRGITKALAISIPIAALIVVLCAYAVGKAREAVHISYFASAAAAQEAFNVGDYETGTHIGKKDWGPGDENHGVWLRLQHSWEGRENLERSFAMRLLRGEAGGESTITVSRQSTSSSGENEDTKPTTCGAAMAVATTMFQGRPLLASAGADSSVQIWYTDKQPMERFAHLRLINKDDGIVPDLRPLKTCGELEREGLSLPGIMSLSFSPLDPSKLAISTGSWSNPNSPGFVLIWDLNRRDRLDSIVPQARFKKTADWVQFSNDGQYLAASSEDATAKIWKFTGGVPTNIRDVNPHEAPDGGSVGGSGAHVVALSPVANHWMAIGYGDGHLVIYDYLNPVSQKPLYVGLAHVSGIMSMLFLEQTVPSQKNPRVRLMVGSRDGDLLLIDPQELMDTYHPQAGKVTRESARDAIKLTLHPEQGVLQGLTAGYSKDHSQAWLLTSGSNGTVGFWAISPNFHLLTTLSGHTGGVHAAAFCQTTQDSVVDSGCIVSASFDHDVRLWTHPFREQTDRHTHLAGRGLLFPGQALGIAFPGNQSDKLVTAVGETTEDSHKDSNVVAIWDYTNVSQEPREFKPDPLASEKPMPMLGFNVSPDGKFLVSTSRDRHLSFVDLKGHSVRESLDVHVTLNPKIRVRCVYPGTTNIIPEDPKDQYNGCSPNQRDYLVIGVADRADIADNFYDQGKGLCLWHITDNGASAKERFSRNEDLQNPCETPLPSRAEWPSPSREFRQVARNVGMYDISADGKTIAASLDHDDKTIVKIWEMSDLLTHPERNTQSENFNAQFVYMAFSPEGKYLAATNIKTALYYWRTDKTKTAGELAYATPATPGTKADGSEETRWDLPARGQVLAFSPLDGETLAVGLQDARIILWDTLYRTPIMEIRQHHGGVLGLAFSPDGKALASSGNDGLVRVMRTEP